MPLKPALAAASVLLLAASVQAQPQASSEALARPAPASLAPMSLALGYDGQIFIIKVLDLQFQQRIDGRGFGAGAQLRSYGLLAAFKHFDIKASASGRIDGEGPEPGAFSYVNHDGKRVRHVVVDWRQDGVAMTSTPPFSDLGSPPADAEQKLASADPLTQLLRMTLAAPQRPCEGAPRFFDGKQYYELAFSGARSAAPSDDQRALGVTSTVRCTVRYNEIAGFKKKPPSKRNNGMNSPILVTFGQIGAGGPWVMAEVRADTPLGPAVIVLRHAHISQGES